MKHPLPPVVDELALRLIESAQDHCIVLTPLEDGLRIENEENAPHSLLWMLREYGDLICQTFRALAAERSDHS